MPIHTIAQLGADVGPLLLEVILILYLKLACRLDLRQAFPPPWISECCWRWLASPVIFVFTILGPMGNSMTLPNVGVVLAVALACLRLKT
jgi:hypothetical protein